MPVKVTKVLMSSCTHTHKQQHGLINTNPAWPILSHMPEPMYCSFCFLSTFLHTVFIQCIFRSFVQYFNTFFRNIYKGTSRFTKATFKWLYIKKKKKTTRLVLCTTSSPTGFYLIAFVLVWTKTNFSDYKVVLFYSLRVSVSAKCYQNTFE